MQMEGEMVVNVNNIERYVDIWLQHSDPKSPPEVQNCIAEYQPKGYFVTVFRSGAGNLTDLTCQLIQHNM